MACIAAGACRKLGQLAGTGIILLGGVLLTELALSDYSCFRLHTTTIQKPRFCSVLGELGRLFYVRYRRRRAKAGLVD